jgi:hypothetical protein
MPQRYISLAIREDTPDRELIQLIDERRAELGIYDPDNPNKGNSMVMKSLLRELVERRKDDERIEMTYDPAAPATAQLVYNLLEQSITPLAETSAEHRAQTAQQLLELYQLMDRMTQTLVSLENRVSSGLVVQTSDEPQEGDSTANRQRLSRMARHLRS